MNVNDIVTVMTLSGEYVGALLQNNGTHVVLKHPKLVTNGENGLALADGISATGTVPDELDLYNVCFVVLSHPDVVTAHAAAVQDQESV